MPSGRACAPSLFAPTADFFEHSKVPVGSHSVLFAVSACADKARLIAGTKWGLHFACRLEMMCSDDGRHLVGASFHLWKLIGLKNGKLVLPCRRPGSKAFRWRAMMSAAVVVVATWCTQTARRKVPITQQVWHSL